MFVKNNSVRKYSSNPNSVSSGNRVLKKIFFSVHKDIFKSSCTSKYYIIFRIIINNPTYNNTERSRPQ